MKKINIFDIFNNEYNCSKLPDKYNQPKYNFFTSYILKHMSIVNRMLYINQLLEKQYSNWAYLVNEKEIDKSNLYLSLLKHKEWERKLINNYFEQEEFIMHLRKVIDDCISLLSISSDCLFYDTKRKLNRPFEMIGELFKVNFVGFKYLLKHKDFLHKINSISNGFKHCVANTMTLKIGINEPCIFVYENNKNSYYNDIGISINELIVDFNDFYRTFDSIIKAE